MLFYTRMSQTVAKNTSQMMIASIFQKVFSFAYFALVARFLIENEVGMYTTALAFTTILVVFVDLGFNSVLIRDVARDNSRAQKYLESILSAKLVLALLSYALLLVLVHVVGYEPQIRQLIYLSGVTMILDSTHLTLYGILRGLGNLKYEAFGLTASQILTLILGGAALYAGLPILFLILAFTIPSAVNVIYAAATLKKKYSLQFRIGHDSALTRKIAKVALPFALAAIFARVYSFIDALMLQKMLGNVATGQYSVAQKIVTAFQFIPLAFIAAVYPKFSSHFVNDKERLMKLFSEVMTLLLIISLPIAVGIGLLSTEIVNLVFSAKYALAGEVLKYLVLSLVFVFLSFPVGAILNACNLQATQTAIVGVVMLINIVSNLLLIPEYGVMGSAYSAIIGNAALLMLGLIFVKKIGNFWEYLRIKKVVKIILGAIIMGGTVFATGNLDFSFASDSVLNMRILMILKILAGAIVYPLALIFLKAVTKKDLQKLKKNILARSA